VSRPTANLRGLLIAIRGRFLGFTSISERSLLLGTVLVLSLVSGATGFILTQYFAKDVVSSLLFIPQDCWSELHWGDEVGRHCFGDYSWEMTYAVQANPWAHLGPPTWLDNNYTAAAMLPHFIFGHLGQSLGAPRLGLLACLFALTVAVLIPALWAARGTRGHERIVVFMACGAVAIPAWTVIDRGNSIGFVVPIALTFLLALRRGQWGLVAVAVILAALVKPQFVLLGVVLLAARRWRLGAITVVGVVASNLLAYLLWPREFPQTIVQSMHNVLGYGTVFTATSASAPVSRYNVSFVKGLLLIPDYIKANHTGGVLPGDFLSDTRWLIGYGIPAIVVIALLALGRRIPPLMVGIVLLPIASLFPVVSFRYYLVFVLPVAAMVVRDPEGPAETGIFDRLADRRRAVGVLVSLAAAFSIAHIVLTFPLFVRAVTGPHGVIELPGTSDEFVETTAVLTPLLWLIACTAIIVSYARRPAPSEWEEAVPNPASGECTTTAF
jgi:hypothetical protein